MAGYIGPAPVPQATQTREVFTLSSTQTTVGTGGYTPGFVDVYLNGAKLAPADFTATNGSDIVLASAAAANDILEVVAFQEFTVVDQTFSGDITFTGANYNLVWDASDDALEFRDTALKISSSADGQLDLDADTEIEITAPTVDIDASTEVNISGALKVDTTTLVVDASNNRVGLGTSLPSQNLHVYGGSILVDNGSSAGTIYFHDTTNYINLSGDELQFANNGSERMRIDSSGNVGIGVTPETAWSGFTALQVGAGVALSGGTGTDELLLTANVYYDGSNYKRISNNYATIYQQSDASHRFFVNGAGTPDVAFTPSEAMRIDSSGNLLVNTASSNTSTTIVGSGGFAVKPQTGNGTRVDISNNGEAMLLDGPSSGPIVAFYNAGSAAGNIGTNNSGDLYIGNDDTTLLFAGGSDMIIPRGTDGATRDGAIDLGAADHRFKTIYGSEYINVGFTDTQNAQLYCSQSANLTGCRIDNSQNSSTSNNFWSVLFGTGNDNTTAVHYAAYTQTGNRFIVYGNGNVQNLNNSYGALSDEKLKENIVDSGSQWDDIKAIKVRKYSLKEAKLDAPNMLGVVAQELETAGMNGLVYESPDRNLDGDDLGTTTKNVNYSVLYMKAVKALQETMARVEALEVKVAALEAGS